MDNELLLRLLQALGFVGVGGIVAILWWRSRVRNAPYAERQRLIGEERHHDRDERLSAQSLPYFKKEFLLTRRELGFFHALNPAVSAMGLCVASKVRLADVINCDSDTWKQGFGAPIAWKHLDFVVFHPLTGRTLLAIELDDASHDRPERTQRDSFLTAVLLQAGVPLMRVRGGPFLSEIVRYEVEHALDTHYGERQGHLWRRQP